MTNSSKVTAVSSSPSPPIARRKPFAFAMHGLTRSDEYHWLADRSTDEVAAHLNAENRYTTAMMRPLAALHKQLLDEIIGTFPTTDVSPSVMLGDYCYYTKTDCNSPYATYCRRRRGARTSEELVLDTSVVARGHGYWRLGSVKVSDDQHYVAYSVDYCGADRYAIYIRDVRSGVLLADTIENVDSGFEWGTDRLALYYVALDVLLRPSRVLRHALGSTDDELIYEERDPHFCAHVSRSRSRKFIYIQLDSNTTSEVLYVPGAEIRPLRIIIPRRHSVQYSVADQGKYFYVCTNDRAPGFKLIRAKIGVRSGDKWQEIVPARPGITIDGIDAFASHIILYERHSGTPMIRVNRAGDFANSYYHVKFSEASYSIVAHDNRDYRSQAFRFTYTSLGTPPCVYELDMNSGNRVLIKQGRIGGRYDEHSYITERVLAKSADGTAIPISLVYSRHVVRKWPRPMLLVGYGAYGIVSQPAFVPHRRCLLDRGIIYGIAHVRGGGELGRAWHEGGKLTNKKNTFSDFIACAEHLIAQGYTSSDRLAIAGASAGGLLVGAVLNMRPGLCRVAIANNPFVDVLSAMREPTLPLTIADYEEWGDPRNREYFDLIRSYSPYDNVRAENYPHMLITTSISDMRVPYWGAVKWAARIRALKTNDSRILLKLHPAGGHLGTSNRYTLAREVAFEYAFLLWGLQYGRQS